MEKRLESVFEELGKPTITLNDNLIDGKMLEVVLPMLKECDAFKETSTLEVIDTPYLETEDGKIYEVGTIKLGDVVFGGRCYIYSIMKLPKPLDKKTIHNPIKDNMVITPTMHNPYDFKPFNRLVVEFNPHELEEEGIEPTLKKIREALTTKKDEYTPEPEYDYLIRGVFEKITNKENKTIENEFGNPILEKEDRKYDVVMYLDYIEDEENKKSYRVTSISKYIPKEYASIYKEKLKEINKNIPNDDSIDIFEKNSRRNDMINNIFKELKI